MIPPAAFRSSSFSDARRGTAYQGNARKKSIEQRECPVHAQVVGEDFRLLQKIGKEKPRVKGQDDIEDDFIRVQLQQIRIASSRPPPADHGAGPVPRLVILPPAIGFFKKILVLTMAPVHSSATGHRP